MKVTRRTLARMLAATAAAGAAEAQTPAQAVPAAGGDPDTAAAREQLQSHAQEMAKVKLPMATEPAFHFKA